MQHSMERSTIHYLKHKGWTNIQIAEFTGHHCDTIASVLREDVDKKPQTHQRPSAVAVFDVQINGWLDKGLPVIRMLELVQEDAEYPYQGGETVFYYYVRKVRSGIQRMQRHINNAGIPPIKLKLGKDKTFSVIFYRTKYNHAAFLALYVFGKQVLSQKHCVIVLRSIF